MSSFKELKKKDKVRAWESKVKRLYSCNDINKSDLRYLNIQFELFKERKVYTSLLTLFSSFIAFHFPILNKLNSMQKVPIAALIGYFIYTNISTRNRYHYETIINPYFEKYYIK